MDRMLYKRILSYKGKCLHLHFCMKKIIYLLLLTLPLWIACKKAEPVRKPVIRDGNSWAAYELSEIYTLSKGIVRKPDIGYAIRFFLYYDDAFKKEYQLNKEVSSLQGSYQLDSSINWLHMNYSADPNLEKLPPNHPLLQAITYKEELCWYTKDSFIAYVNTTGSDLVYMKYRRFK